MNRDKKILFGLGIFICSIAMISVIKGTYAYPSTMENTGGGRIVPLGGDEVCSKCDNSYVYAPVGADNCTPVADSYCTSKPSTTPSVKPSPSPSPSVKPSPSPSPSEKPSIPTPRYNACYYCERDNIYHFGYREELGYCSGSWTIVNLDESRCNNWYVTPSPSEKPPISSSPSSTPNSYCYVCSTDDNKFYWGVYPVPSSISSSCSGTWKGTARTQEQCHAEDIPSNPNTGDVMLYIAYLIGFSSLFYSGYSFYRYKKQNNK